MLPGLWNDRPAEPGRTARAFDVETGISQAARLSGAGRHLVSPGSMGGAGGQLPAGFVTNHIGGGV